MNRKIMFVILAVVILLVGVTVVSAAGRSELATVKRATVHFRNTETARLAGYDLRDGLDHCFDNQPVGAMGYHFINTDILDAEVDVLKPEAMVYAPGPRGQLKLAAVEYIVDQASWDAANPGEVPEVLGQELHAHSSLPIYILHAWIWRNNPSGMFEDCNPNVSCPSIKLINFEYRKGPTR